jgi:hypothetical protein
MSTPDERRARPVCIRTGPRKNIALDDDNSQYPWCCQGAAPSRYGLTDEQLWRHATELFRSGWSTEEISRVIALPERVS